MCKYISVLQNRRTIPRCAIFATTTVVPATAAAVLILAANQAMDTITVYMSQQRDTIYALAVMRCILGSGPIKTHLDALCHLLTPT